MAQLSFDPYPTCRLSIHEAITDEQYLLWVGIVLESSKAHRRASPAKGLRGRRSGSDEAAISLALRRRTRSLRIAASTYRSRARSTSGALLELNDLEVLLRARGKDGG